MQKQPIRTALLAIVFSLASAPVVWAAEGQEPHQSPAVSLLIALLPLVLIFVMMGGLLWWYSRKYQRSSFVQRSIEYYERSEQHMQRLEQLLERIAAALEKKDV